ncbi:unnamed protein product [Rotaria sp. Silwood1]|nr:unnamed protein product [Rotaria sp. Silwood1]CAF0941469.1 unnamed protein product [Rotaria sp. Silwood1]CAF3393104.1 unnamed protein product [Rotaria sp. Silwood1]CAF3394225.1 unnamed protein product [Rotaria sp. Silwood1]CAF4606829.1 unnamed protein product [Rotaria sp. Silwood1]
MATVFVAVGIALILYVGYRLYQHLFPPPNINPYGKYVLISGCDSGFGHGLAIELDKQGFHVLASVFNPDAEERLTSQLSNRATVFCLDITQQQDIDIAYDIVTKKTNTLHALVNNAGIGNRGFIDWTSLDFVRETMEVNFFGHVSMTKKFLPLLISRRGSRVVNICSVAGYMATAGVSAYACSKFALEAFSDCLRREMYSWGLYVSIIEPGYMRTPIIEAYEHTCRNLWADVPEDVRKRWGEDFFRDYMIKIEKHPFIINAENPQKVIKAIRHAVMNTAPRIRYRPGWQSSLFFFPLSMLPAWLADYILIKIKGAYATPTGILEQSD